jgi:tetratricopeptide (TPR) repeat protein
MKKKIILTLILLISLTLFAAGCGKKPEQTQKKEYPNEAIAGLEDKRSKDQENADILFELALEYQRINDFDNAIALYKKLLEIKPGENLYRFNLGDIYIQQKKYKEGADILWAAIQRNIKELNSYSPLLDIYEWSEDKSIVPIDDVIANLHILEEDKAGVVSPIEHQQTIIYLARAYKLKGDYENAIKYYEKKIEEKIGSEEANREEIDSLKEKMEKE